jgi:phospho-N-acetylmuramoyl-pentapeptide-transferase
MDISSITFYTLISAGFSLLISFPIIQLLYKFKIVRLIDKDFSALIDTRRLKLGTPIMGGLIVVITVLVVNVVLNLCGTTKMPLLVFLISALLGALDDVLNIYGRERPVRSIYRTLKLSRVHKSIKMRIFYIVTLPWAALRWFFYLLGSNPGKGIQAHEKIIVQFVTGVAVAWWQYFRTGAANPGEMWIPFVGMVDIGLWMIPLIIFVVMTMANAVNISDGMDGLSAGLSVFAFIGFFFIALTMNNIPIAKLIITVIGALLVYLYFNVPPARFQMGDVGSLALGTLLATVAFELNREILLLLFGCIFLIELTSVIVQGVSRRLLGKRLFKMAPLHHHFEMIGWPEPKVVMRFWVISPFLILLGIFLSQF